MSLPDRERVARALRRTRNIWPSAVRSLGWPTALRSLPAYLRWQLQAEIPGWSASESGSTFDEEYGTDTSSAVEGYEMADMTAERFQRGYVRYHPTPVATVRALLEALPIVRRDHAFVDYGCGKGRVLLLASEYGFKKLVGIEFSREMCAVAEKNGELYGRKKGVTLPLTIENVDAVDYEPPPDPAVLFFYEPLYEQDLRRALMMVGESLERVPRPIYVLCVGTNALPTFQSVPFLEKLDWLRSADGPRYDSWIFANDEGVLASKRGTTG